MPRLSVTFHRVWEQIIGWEDRPGLWSTGICIYIYAYIKRKSCGSHNVATDDEGRDSLLNTCITDYIHMEGQAETIIILHHHQHIYMCMCIDLLQNTAQNNCILYNLTCNHMFRYWAHHKILTVLTGFSRRSHTRMYAEETEKPSRDSSLYFTTTTLFGCPNTDWISHPVCKSHTFTLRSGNNTQKTVQLVYGSYGSEAPTVNKCDHYTTWLTYKSSICALWTTTLLCSCKSW